MKKYVAIFLMFAMITLCLPIKAEAAQQDNDMLVVLKSSFYGGLTGALIGTAILAFRDKPSDHTEDIQIGAGVGIIVGTLYGLAKTTQAFVQVEDGNLTVQMPTFRFDVDQDTHDLRGSVDLLKIPF